MAILLAFAPFIVFALLERYVGPLAGLAAAALLSAALLMRDRMTTGRAPKILELGTLILFVALALYAAFGRPTWSIIGVRLCVDVGLLLIVLVSVAVGRPFTLQYAREQVAPEFWARPEFVRANYVITATWALAFAVIVIADLALLYAPGAPRPVGVIAIILALVGAVKFTNWYPARVRAAIKRAQP
jgi:hypothetical protein